jgi:two-component system OmpR family sensor kinase
LFEKIARLKTNVINTVIFSILSVIVLAWLLGKIFMKPMQTRIKQIEDFVHDTAHELNTPITALRMSVSRAIKKETCDNKLLKNISVSTKQLFDIYNALSYLSFESNKEEVVKLDMCKVVEKSVAYYEELAQSKNIVISSTCREFSYKIDEVKLTMLFGNLINNAIKYSHPNSKIEVEFIDGVFKIKDYGIGIPQDKLDTIYDRFNRETDYAGGFGIGLSIVKKITQEYNLALHVESKLGEGTMFEVGFN